MKKKMVILVAVLGLGYISAASAENMRLFDIKSGKVTYTIRGSANMMGIATQIEGKKRVVFDNYGARNLTETVRQEKRSGMGGNQTTKTHTMTLMDGGTIYQVDFRHKKIIKMANVGAAMLGGGNMRQKGLAMMKQMGGRKTGTDRVLGYTCDIWELMGTKQCIYKGITLKVESNIMGITNTEIATDAEFDIGLSGRDFKLPDYPVQEGTGPMNTPPGYNGGGRAIQQPSAQDMAKMAEAVKAMGAAVQNSGMDMHNPDTSPQAQQKLQNAMISAMMPQMKQQMLSQEKVLMFLKRCLTDADILGAAQQCAHKADEMMGESGEPLEKWDARTKEETLQEIDRALEGVACARQAKTPQAMQHCMQ